MSLKTTLNKKALNIMLGLLMKKPFQQVLLPFGSDLQPEKWIFVVGCYDSGTTLLAKILGELPGFGGLPNEGQFLTDVLPYPETYGWPRMFCECLDKISMDGAGFEEAQRIKRHWSIWYPRKAKYLVEKSITSMTRMQYLQKYFHDAYFIHIIRDGYAVAKGIQRNANMNRWGTPYDEYPIDMCARQWQVADDIAVGQAKGLKNYMPLYYEDFAEKTSESMARIMEFIGVDLPDVDIANHEWKIHGARSKIINMNSKAYDLLSDQDIATIQAVAGDALKRHGYTPPR